MSHDFDTDLEFARRMALSMAALAAWVTVAAVMVDGGVPLLAGAVFTWLLALVAAAWAAYCALALHHQDRCPRPGLGGPGAPEVFLKRPSQKEFGERRGTIP